MLETIGCAHDLCNCVITAEIQSEKFCGDACRNAVENSLESATCPCGHPPCDSP